jgi:hypothetical protein
MLFHTPSLPQKHNHIHSQTKFYDQEPAKRKHNRSRCTDLIFRNYKQNIWDNNVYQVWRIKKIQVSRKDWKLQRFEKEPNKISETENKPKMRTKPTGFTADFMQLERKWTK